MKQSRLVEQFIPDIFGAKSVVWPGNAKKVRSTPGGLMTIVYELGSHNRRSMRRSNVLRESAEFRE
jgi:hypothetical protein